MRWLFVALEKVDIPRHSPLLPLLQADQERPLPRLEAEEMKPDTPPIPCALATYLPSGTNVEALKRKGWSKDGILVVNVNDLRLKSIERQMLLAIGERLYGQG
jgi:hypothetical protein